jgi:hypothetical protein
VCRSVGKHEGQLTKCRLGRQKQFCYGSILLSFFFERVPTSCPWDVVPDVGYRDPTMKKWTYLLSRLGGEHNSSLMQNFFRWWDRQIVAIDDYAYHGVDYRDDPDMVLPEGERFNDEFGKKDKFSVYIFLVFLMFFVIL